MDKVVTAGNIVIVDEVSKVGDVLIASDVEILDDVATVGNVAGA